ncbi:MAG: hypothetical protein QOJ25_1593 [Solirubrobacteraceae bacterium]|jgi:hypothetical protein|nr:hypothetical protein [Solirubrobacteraceae bacterium]
MRPAIVTALATGVLAALTAGCGASPSPSPTTSPSPGATSSATKTHAAAGALSADATSAATGDIPDNQQFLTYHNPTEHYSILYPEGWALKGSARDVSFTDKNNVVHIIIAAAPAPTTATLAGELSKLKRSDPTLAFSPPATIAVKSGTAVKATYTTRSGPNPVTGKSVLLVVDRYELSRGGRRATVDLGTPKGVDNVDAYRKMINSFSWQ